MENKAYTFLAGLFALLLGAALAIGFWWLGGSHHAETEYEILSVYPITGLNPQAAVRYRGVDIGRVRTIGFDKADARAIIIRIKVDSDIPMTQGTYAKLMAQGLTGLSYIELDDTGKDQRPLDNHRIPLRESDIRQLMNSGQEILNKANLLLDKTDRLMKTLNVLLDEQNMQKIQHIIGNMEQASAELAPLLRSSHAVTEKVGKLADQIHPHELSDALQAIRAASASVKDTADTARPTIVKLRQSLDEFERIGRHIEQVSAELGSSLNGDTLPRVNELTQQLHEDAASLNRLINTLEQNPQSLIYGKPQPAPGPGEKGFKP